MLNVSQMQTIAKHVALQAKYMTDFQRTFDYGEVKLYSESAGKLVSPPDKMRRLNDFLAAAYTHSIALYANSGDDCIDQYGNAIELKLAFIKGKEMRIGTSGRAIVTGPSATGLMNSVNAKFRVYEGTDREHHNKDTAFILMSLDHNCYITGFMMPGDRVTEILHASGKNTEQRDVSLSNFIKHGYEFGSSVPHIGWNEYYDALWNYLHAREGRITGDDAEAAITKWISLADEKNLKAL
jgi:hypothetical protein